MNKNDTFKNIKRKHGISIGFVVALVAGILFTYTFVPLPSVQENDDGEWHIIFQGKPTLSAEYANPDTDGTGWCSTFLLDYAETPGTCLASNATNGAYDAWGNVTGYLDVDGDGQPATDIPSEDPFYFVVRCRFNDTVKSGGDFISARCRCLLNVTGDESIDDVAIDGHDTDIGGGGRAVISQNDSGDDFIWINFVWDDGSDGYQILDDGSLEWSITISAKY